MSAATAQPLPIVQVRVPEQPALRLPKHLLILLHALYRRQSFGFHNAGLSFASWCEQVLEKFALDSYEDVFDSEAMPYREFVKQVNAGVRPDLRRYLR